MPLLTSITRNIPAFIRDPAVSLIGQKCYVSLVEDLNTNDVACLRLALSKGLGIGIVVGGSIMKVPQVLTILRAKSAKGISLPAYVLETLSYAIATTYSARNYYPFSTYGENFFLTIQNVVITFLVVHYNARNKNANLKGESAAPRLVISAFAVLFGTYLLYSIPLNTLQALQFSAVPLSIFSKLPQIQKNYRARSTGQLSTFAISSQIAGCIARVFTTATEVDDPLVLAGFVAALLLNLVLGAQMWIYWGRGDEESVLINGRVSLSGNGSEKSAVFSTPIPTSTTPTQGGRRWARKVD